MHRKSLLLSLLIGQTFIWTGSAFMTVLYHLYDYYDGAAVTLITEGLFYVMQAVGISVFALFFRYRGERAGKAVFVSASILLTALFTVASLLARSGLSTILFGSLMNIGVGLLSGQFFTRIAAYVPRRERALSFGIAYALGSIGTYLLSLPDREQGLTAPWLLYVYVAMMALSLVFSRYLTDRAETTEYNNEATDRRLLLLAFAVPFLCYLVYTLGYHFATIDMSFGVDPAFIRAFYAFSLIIAGIISDRSRRAGALLGFLILVFPFVSLALRDVPGTATFLGILNYLFVGFLSVYRVILFTDVSTRSSSLLYTAPFGLMLGTLGTAAGTAVGLVIDNNPIILTLVTAMLFMLCGVLFFLLFIRLYLPPKAAPAKSKDSLLYDFQVKYSLNGNQMEVFKLILNGNSNGQIASELHLAESTVKYHVKNILRATECSNRNDLVTLFHEFCS